MNKVAISPNEIDFGELEDGRVYTKEIIIQNVYRSSIKERVVYIIVVPRSLLFLMILLTNQQQFKMKKHYQTYS